MLLVVLTLASMANFFILFNLDMDPPSWHSIDLPFLSRDAIVTAKAAVGSNLSVPEYGLQPRQRLQSPIERRNESEVSPSSAHMQIMLLRAIGNPLPPRHDPDQAFDNLKFILENEEDFPYLTKWWVLNRLVNETLLHELESLLESHGQQFFVIPFNLTEYANIRDCTEKDAENIKLCDSRFEKLLYITNQNQARNAMIEFGQTYSPKSIDWIMPWDGNCYLHKNSYRKIYIQLRDMPSNLKYAVTMMNRVVLSMNKEVLIRAYRPIAIEEPQIIFHRTALGRFNPRLSYGKRNKLDFIQRLNVKGSWDRIPVPKEVTERNARFSAIPDLPNGTATGEGPQVQSIGFVTRLSSGRPALERNVNKRFSARIESITSIISQADARVTLEVKGFRPGQLVFYHEDALERDRRLFRDGDARMKSIVDELQQLARRSLSFGPWSVTDKPDSSIAVSGDKHDYFQMATNHQAPSSEVAKDPKLQLQAQVYGPGSGDRARLQEMMYNTTILALTFFMTGEQEFGQVAARNVRRWFLTADTRMNPHMKYAQGHKGRHNYAGSGACILEFRGIYFMLDAIRIIERDGFLTQDEQNELRVWMGEYLHWLESTYPDDDTTDMTKNQWLYYDIQVYAITAFLQDTAKMIWHAERSTRRLDRLIELDGRMSRPFCENCYIALVGWSTLSRMSQNVDRNMWTVPAKHSTLAHANGTLQLSALCRAAQYAVPWFGGTEKCEGYIDAEETAEQWWPLLLEVNFQCPLLRRDDTLWPIPWFKDDVPRPPPKSQYEMPNHFFSHDSTIAPYWNLGLPHGNITFAPNQAHDIVSI